ncbi:gamma-interferon-inducible lysosomal thiol reductase-like protein [Rhynchophorus ferrugineus]|uniref:gamma-interferon-inducible lysosomal thiol reductase-like protein n=1 Tax=Rhynchophorus ferrugineus TaxID=354439 RepID=UPI003FCEB9C7
MSVTGRLSFMAVLILIAATEVRMKQRPPSTKEKLSVDIYFESLCPDSLNFIRTQLYPSWRDIAPYVNIKLIPFGKSVSFENGTQFICQHGPSECRGNRIMSCVLSRIPNQNMQVEYVNCFMGSYLNVRKDQKETGRACAQRVGVNMEKIIQNCYLTGEGTQLQLAAEFSTSTVLPRFIPTIIYNGVFNQKLQDASLRDFRKVVCDLINNIPESCRHSAVIAF